MKKLTKHVIVSGHIKTTKSERLWYEYCPEVPEEKRLEVYAHHTCDGPYKCTDIRFTWREE